MASIGEIIGWVVGIAALMLFLYFFFVRGAIMPFNPVGVAENAGAPALICSKALFKLKSQQHL